VIRPFESCSTRRQARYTCFQTRYSFRGTIGVLRNIAEHERIKAALQEEKQKIEELHEVASEMEACQTNEEICDLTVDAAESILEFDICSVDLVEDGYFVPKAISTGMTADGYSRLRVDDGVAGQTYRNHETYVVDDVREESDAVPEQAEYRSLLRFPVGEEGIFQVGPWGSGRSTRMRQSWPSCSSHTPAKRSDASVCRPPSARARRSTGRWSNRVTTPIYIYRDDRFVFVNQHVCDFSGYSREELAEMEIWELLHLDDRERVKRLADERAHGNDSPHYEARVVTERKQRKQELKR
jgi:PAS domain-containing protein